MVKIQTTDDFIELAIKKAIKEYSLEQKAERNKKALHNTKLLLKNYNRIKKSVEEGMTNILQINKSNMERNNFDESYIESIRRSKIGSLVMITHLDNALVLIEQDYENKGIPEKYNAFKSCIIDEMTYEDAALIYNSSKTSISRWINEITVEVSVQLFGVEGLELI